MLKCIIAKQWKVKKYNSAFNDVYEVAQQAIKSTIWVSSKGILLEKINNRKWSSKADKFVKGSYKTLKKILESSKLLRVKVYIVQPAISKSAQIPETLGTILSAATSFIKRTGKVQELLILGSE